jgi:hypothetical protein
VESNKNWVRIFSYFVVFAHEYCLAWYIDSSYDICNLFQLFCRSIALKILVITILSRPNFLVANVIFPAPYLLGTVIVSYYSSEIKRPKPI